MTSAESPPSCVTLTEEVTAQALLFRDLADTLPEQLAYFDQGSSTCRFANLRYAQCYGLTSATIVGKHARDIVDGATWAFAKPYLERASAGQRQSYQREIVANDGSFRMVHVSMTPHLDASGQQRGVLVVSRDITARWQAERASRESEARLQKFAQATQEAIVFHRRGSILDSNDAMTRLVGYTPDEVLGTDIFDYIVPGDRAAAQAYARRGDEFLYEVSLLHRDGHAVPVEVIGKTMPLQGADYRVVVVRDIRSRRHMQQREAFLTLHDALTELPNRRSLLERLETALASARHSAVTCAVLSVNLDHFKTINDSLGHAAGDKLLREVARRLLACLGVDGFVARPEGDEFVLVAPALSHCAADALAQKVLKAIAQPTDVAGTPLMLSASVGVALFPEHATSASGLIRQAEAAQRLAKQSGRGHHQFSIPDLFPPPIESLRLEHELRAALQTEGLVLHYQPEVYLPDGRVAGVEALVRWEHPTRGLLPPSAFIEFAESHGLIASIGRWVLAEACRQAKRWQDAGLIGLSMAVNVSAVEFRQRDVAREIAQVLSETGLDARCLEIELTEGVLMHYTDTLMQSLRAIKALGVRITIDDFGTGYSSLSYLKRYPLDKLKIDRSFVMETPHNADDVAIVTAVIQLAQSLQLQTVAEGVETEAQHQLLSSLGCDLGQGYWLARPMTAEAATRWLQAQWKPNPTGAA